jgi:hypothetical protein
MIGKWCSTALITARTAATRDGGQSNDAAAGGAVTSATRSAARAAVLTAAMVLAAACGSAPGYRDPHRLETAVRHRLEQALMTVAPRQSGSRTATHIRSIRCRHRDDDAFRCVARLGDNSKLTVPVQVSPDGRRFRIR